MRRRVGGLEGAPPAAHGQPYIHCCLPGPVLHPTSAILSTSCQPEAGARQAESLAATGGRSFCSVIIIMSVVALLGHHHRSNAPLVDRLQKVSATLGLRLSLHATAADALARLQTDPTLAGGGSDERCSGSSAGPVQAPAASNAAVILLVCKLGKDPTDACWPVLAYVKQRRPDIFSVVFSRSAARSPLVRLDCFAAGARMVSSDAEALEEVLRRVAQQRLRYDIRPQLPGEHEGEQRQDCYTCPDCRVSGLDLQQLHAHHPLYHVSEPASSQPCPVCGATQFRSLLRHIHDCHDPSPPARAGAAGATHPPALSLPQGSPSLSAFSWVVCVNEAHEFLMVNERAEGAGADSRCTGCLQAGSTPERAWWRQRCVRRWRRQGWRCASPAC